MYCEKCIRYYILPSEDAPDGICHNCRKQEQERTAKIRSLQRRYDKERAIAASERRNKRYGDLGGFWFRMAVINCYWRQNLKIHEIAEVLRVDAERIEFEIDMARQDAR